MGDGIRKKIFPTRDQKLVGVLHPPPTQKLNLPILNEFTGTIYPREFIFDGDLQIGLLNVDDLMLLETSSEKEVKNL